MKTTPKRLEAHVGRLIGLPCWHATGGKGLAPSSFCLAIGARIRRRRALRSPGFSREYRHFTGEADLLVWCAWRLEGARTPVASSESPDEEIESGLQRLVGKTVLDAKVGPPGWDLVVSFSGRLTLRLFCDRVDADEHGLENWSLHFPRKVLAAGPGYRWRISRDAAAE